MSAYKHMGVPTHGLKDTKSRAVITKLPRALECTDTRCIAAVDHTESCVEQAPATIAAAVHEGRNMADYSTDFCFCDNSVRETD